MRGLLKSSIMTAAAGYAWKNRSKLMRMIKGGK